MYTYKGKKFNLTVWPSNVLDTPEALRESVRCALRRNDTTKQALERLCWSSTHPDDDVAHRMRMLYLFVVHDECFSVWRVSK